ncbi:hypothetical protein ACUXAM_000153 [Staphylococcus epidermidis]
MDKASWGGEMTGDYDFYPNLALVLIGEILQS